MTRTFFERGFTLIELLVVVAIISLLSSVVIVSLQDSREKAAITKLKEQTRQIQTALELYRSDYGEYPSADSMSFLSKTELSGILDAYIEPFDLASSNIHSFQIDDIYYVNNNDWLGAAVFGCAGYASTPYVIIMETDNTAINEFSHVDIDDQIAPDSYCLNTPI